MKFVYQSLFILSIMVFAISYSEANWSPPVLIDTTTPLPPGPRIAAKGDSIAVIYGDDRFIRSLDGGTTWQDEFVMPDGRFPYDWRDLKYQGDTLMIYSIYGLSNSNLAFYISTDFGQSWEEPRQNEDYNPWLGYYSAQFEGNSISICNVIELTGEVYLVNSTDFGINWSEPETVHIYNDIAEPLIDYFFGQPYVLVEHSEFIAEPLILSLLFSTDNGYSWIHNDSLVTQGANWFQSIDASSEGHMAFVYHDNNTWEGDGSWVYAAVSADSGWTWSDPINISISNRNYFPRVAISGDTIITAFDGRIDSMSENYAVIIRRSYDLGQTWQSPEILTDLEVRGLYPDIFLSNGLIHIVYHIVNDGLYYRRWEPETAIDNEIDLPLGFSLSQNHPNPFNAATSISYSLPKAGEVVISIYNLLGQRVDTIYEGTREAGEHKVVWDAADFPSGIYFARLEAGESIKNIKMVLLK